MAKYEVTKSVDVRGEVCPVPDVETKRALKKMKSGEILEVWIDYAMSTNSRSTQGCCWLCWNTSRAGYMAAVQTTNLTNTILWVSSWMPSGFTIN